MISELCCNFKVLIYNRITNKNRYDHWGQSYWNILYGRRLLQVFWCNDNKIYTKTYRKKEISSKFYNVKGRSYADNNPFPRFWLSLLQTFLSWKSMQAASPSISTNYFSKEAVHQCIKNHWHTACIVQSSLDSR